jgi:RND family efflux transporter MFP subunit
VTPILAFAMISCAPEGVATAQAEAGAEVPIVTTITPSRSDLSKRLTLTAEFTPYQEVDVMAKVSGYLREINVDIGDRVVSGQVLATLEVPELNDDVLRADAVIDEAAAGLSTAQNELTQAKSGHDIAHLSYERLLGVSKREPGLIPLQEVDEARSRDLVAEAQVASATSRIQCSEQRARVSKAEKSRLLTLQRYTTITAPFDGVVTKRYANVGAMIQAATSSQTQAMPLVRLSQNNLLRLVLPLPESSVAYVRVGELVKVRVASLDRDFTGHVTRFADKIQMSTRTMDTEVDVPNTDLVLIPGMYAEVNLILQEHKSALTLPLGAVDGLGSGSARVFRVGGDNLISILPVKTGLEDSNNVEIVSGLGEGDQVVVGRRGSLSEGQRVEPRLTPSNPDGAQEKEGE